MGATDGRQDEFKQHHDTLDALAEVVGGQLGPQGCFSHLSRERTEEILLLLLRRGRWVRAHRRVWSIPIPADMLEPVHIAGGETKEEWEARIRLIQEARAKAEGR